MSRARIGFALSCVFALIGASAMAPAFAAGPTPGPTATGTASTKIVWTYGSNADVDSMNQFNMVSYGYTIHTMAYDTLTGLSTTDFSPVPDIADHWSISPDGLTWTFHIRSGMKWSDGVPLTAFDVAYTYNRIIDEQQGCCVQYLAGVKKGGITTPDANTLIIHTSTPHPQLAFIYIYIYPEHIWEHISTRAAKTYENFPGVTSGPFHPTVWKKGQYMTLEANPHYWAGKPHVDEIDWRVFNNNDAAVQALKSGEIDFLDALPPNLFDSLKGYPGVGLHQAVTTEFDDLAINTSGGKPQGDPNPALTDPNFRRALAMAVDKQTLVDKVILGHGAVGTTIVPPLLAKYHLSIPKADLIPFDIAGANALLDRSGYKDTDGDGIRNLPNGGPDIKLRYFLASSIEATAPTAQFVQSWFKQIGIGTTVKAYGDDKLTDIEQSGQYDIAQWDFFSDIDPDFILSVATCGQRPAKQKDGSISFGWSDTFYCNAAYDQLYEQQKTSLDQRVQIVKQMQQQLYDAVTYIVLWYPADLQAFSTRFTGFKPQPNPNGDLTAAYGPFGWDSIRLNITKGGSAAPAVLKGISTAGWAGILVGLIVLGAGTSLFQRRRNWDQVE